MKTKTSLLLLTLATTLGLAGPVAASHLKAPDDLVCERGFDNMVHSKWKNREGATYYAVDVTAEYDVSGDGQMDRIQDFHFGSHDPELVLNPAKMKGSFVEDTRSRVVDKMPMAANIRVKAVHLGKGHYKAADKSDKSRSAIDGQSRNADYTECRVTLGAPCRFCR